MLSQTYEEVASAINAAIASAKPFSLVRLGDSENSILAHPYSVSAGRIASVLSRVIEDRAFAPDEVAAIREGLIRAADGADVAGLYPSDHPNEFCALKSLTLRRANIAIKAACYPTVHFYLAASGHLARMIGAAEHVTLITGRDIKQRFDQRFGTDAEMLLVPPERVFTLAEEGSRPPHYPQTYEDVLGRIEAKGGRHLFLVGAGILGKAYCQRAKEVGGIAVDIGSVFDYWAGLPTREKKVPCSAVVKDGVAQKIEPARLGLGLDDAPVEMSLLRDAHAIGFKRIELYPDPRPIASLFKEYARAA